MHVISYKMWCGLIKYGCDAFYRLYDIVHIVDGMSYLERVWYHQTSGCYDTDPVAVMSYTMDMMLWIIAEVISEIQLVWYLQYTGCDDTDTVDMMSNIDLKPPQARWFEVIKWGCDILYRANNAIHMKSLMSYKGWVWCSLYITVWCPHYVWGHWEWLWCVVYSVYVALHTGCGFIYIGCDVLSTVVWWHKDWLWCYI